MCRDKLILNGSEEMLDTVIIEINKYKEADSLADLIKGTAYDVLTDIEEVANPLNAFVLTDSRDKANRAKEKGIGFALYLNGENSYNDFPDALYCIESINDIEDKTLNRMYLRYIGEPWTIITTDRCIVREIKVEDVDDLYAIYEDEETSKYIEPLYEDKNDEIEFTKAYISNQYRFYEYGMWVVLDRETNKLIGRAGVTVRDGFDIPEIGFIFEKSYWGKGYAYEVMMGIMQYVKEEFGMESLISFTKPENERAKKFLEKLGFIGLGQIVIDGINFLKYERNK